MTPLHVNTLLVLAQMDDTLGDFLYQVRGLVAFVCALAILWVALLVLTIQRNAERRRRQKLGLEPLPNMWVSLYRWIMQKDSGQDKTPDAPARVPPADDDALLAPDLGLLTGDLGEPDWDVFDGPDAAPDAPTAIVPERARSVPAEPLAADDEAEMIEDVPMTDHDDALPVMPRGSADSAPPADSVELLRVFRDLSDGTLIVEVDGRRFSSADELAGANLTRRFSKVVKDLAQWVRDAQMRTAQAPPAPPVAPAPTPGTAARHSLPDDEMPSMGPGTMFRQMTRAAMGHKPETPPAEDTPDLSIPEQIEELLQARLIHMPEFRERTIHVKPSLSGGVRIQVDDTYYEGVGDIADDDVRALLQDVVREWENRYG